MRTRIAVILLAIALVLIAKPIYEDVMLLRIDYGMTHQTGVLCFDYEDTRCGNGDCYINRVVTPENFDTNVHYWRTANNIGLDGHGVGYHGYNEI